MPIHLLTHGIICVPPSRRYQILCKTHEDRGWKMKAPSLCGFTLVASAMLGLLVNLGFCHPDHPLFSLPVIEPIELPTAAARQPIALVVGHGTSLDRATAKRFSREGFVVLLAVKYASKSSSSPESALSKIWRSASLTTDHRAPWLDFAAELVQEIEEGGGSAYEVYFDALKRAEIRKALGELISRIDVLIQNAGDRPPHSAVPGKLDLDASKLASAVHLVETVSLLFSCRMSSCTRCARELVRKSFARSDMEYVSPSVIESSGMEW